MKLEVIHIEDYSFKDLVVSMKDTITNMTKIGYELKSHSHSEAKEKYGDRHIFRAIMIFEKKDEWKFSS